MKNKIALYIGLSLMSFEVFGQNNPNVTVIESNAIRNVIPARKAVGKPEIKDTTASLPAKNYALVPKTEEVNHETEEIKPAKLKVVEPLSKLYRGYVKAGVGNYTTPFLDVHYMEKRSRSGSYGLNFKHFSSRNGSATAYSGFADNEFHAYGKKFLDNYALSSNLDMEFNGLHHFGGVPDTIAKEIIKQRFSGVQFGGKMKSYFKDSNKVNHSIYLDYYYFQDYKDTENKHKFDFARENNFDLGADFSFYKDNYLIHVDALLDYNHYKSDTINPCIDCDSIVNHRFFNKGNGIFTVNPYVTLKHGIFDFKLGTTIGIDIPNQISNNAEFHIYPDMELNANLFDGIFAPYVGITGGLERNSFKTLARENAFLLSSVQLLNSSKSYEFFGGFRGSLTSKIAFNLGVKLGKTKNDALFVTDTTFSQDNRFDVVYDDITTTNFVAQLAYLDGEKLRIYLNGDYYLYKTTNQIEAWYKPDFKITTSATYDLEDKIIGRLDIFAIGNRRASSLKEVEGGVLTDGIYVHTLPLIVDANIGFEYRLSKKFSAFLNFNNLVSRRYQKYLRYPVQGINILGGVTFSF